MAYFDYNATAPLSSAAREAWLHASDEAWQNPSSPYRSAARVRNLLEAARLRLATSLGCQPGQLIFNSGATEGINAIFQYCATHPDLKERPVLVSPFEHPSVLAAAKLYFPQRLRFCESHGPGGHIDLHSLQSHLEAERFALVSIMAANNETGMIQPWAEIGRICRNAGALFHCDAAQWIGKMPAQGIGRGAFVTAAAHKFGGPKGCGLLVTPPEASGFRCQAGGEQEHGARAGTESYPDIAAMLAALEESQAYLGQANAIATRLAWRTEFEEVIQQRIPETRIAGQASERLWNTSSLILPIGRNDRWVRKLDRAGFQVSTGSACATGKEGPSHVLAALGFPPDAVKRAVRVSSGWATTRENWLSLAEAMEKTYRELRNDHGEDGENRLTEIVRI